MIVLSWLTVMSLIIVAWGRELPWLIIPPGRLCGNRDWATLSGWVGVHQFVRLGKLVMVGGLSKVVMDIPPIPCRWTPGSDFRFKCGGDEKKRDRGRTKGEN